MANRPEIANQKRCRGMHEAGQICVNRMAVCKPPATLHAIAILMNEKNQPSPLASLCGRG
jgi:poly-beta-hydroxyalkanoate depolymerase